MKKFMFALMLALFVSLISYSPVAEAVAVNNHQNMNSVNSSNSVMISMYSRLSSEKDDSGRLNRAMADAVASTSKSIEINGSYTIDETVTIPSNITVFGDGKITMTDPERDALLIKGGNTEGAEGKNIKISGIEIGGGRYCIQVYGKDAPYKPHDITIEKVTTTNSAAAGIYINSGTDINILDCTNDGGSRHVGIESPLSDKTACKNILVSGCSTKNTLQFGYQAYYGENISIIGCYCDGSQMVSGDKTGITIDRAKNAVVSSNTMINAPFSQILITGAEQVICSKNICTGGTYGLQVNYNFEYVEDASITVSKNVNIVNNICVNNGIAIILNGVQDSIVDENIMKDSSIHPFHIQSSTRADSLKMTTSNICINGIVADIE